MKPLSVSNKFKITAIARYDLLKIGQYTELKWGKSQRNHYLKQLDEAFNLIAVNPKIGKDRSHVRLVFEGGILVSIDAIGYGYR